MAIERWRPKWGLARAPFSEMEREMDEMFDRFFREWPWPRLARAPRAWAPSMDMVNRPDEVVLRADLPGLEQKDVQVTVEDGLLTIKGERKEEKEVKEQDYYACERWAGAFARSIDLPPGLETDKIKATLRNGVLEVHLPKSQATS
jgi:HSP20 family protein